MSVTLFTYSRQNVSLADALQAFGAVPSSAPATAILYSPRWCKLAKWESTRLTGPDGHIVDISSVFEARVFNTTAELRWLDDPGPEKRQRAIVLTEQDHVEILADWERCTQPPIIETLPQTYLLWGEGTGRSMPHGWSELATARIGALSVPIGDVDKHQRALLHSVEYVVEAEHGNAVVFEERLVKLEVVHG